MDYKINKILNEDKLLDLIYNNNVSKFKTYVDEEFSKKELSYYNSEQILSLIKYLDLTSLKTTDNLTNIIDFIKNSSFEFNGGSYNVGGICCFSKFLQQINQYKPSKQIKSVVVTGGFPHSQLPLSIKLEEIKYAIENNVDEIDICLNRGVFLEGQYEEIRQEICATKDLLKQSDKKILLKVILEVGEIESYSNIMQASLLSLESGVDFIKTSTGKIPQGADIYSVIVMLMALREYYKKTKILKGIKIAGGVKTIQESIQYKDIYEYFIFKNPSNELFRIGCSQLFDKIQSELLKNNN